MKYSLQFLCSPRLVSFSIKEYQIVLQEIRIHIGSYEKDLRAKIFRQKFFEKLFYKLSDILKR